MLRDQIGIEVVFVNLTPLWDLDYLDLESKLTPNTKVVSITGGSNVTGSIFDWKKISKLTREKTPGVLLVMDASQRIAHEKISVRDFDLDFLVCTGHKIWADTGIGILYGKRELLKTVTPSI